MATIVAEIPERFWQVTYDPDHDPDSPDLCPMAQGANCQNFAYEILGHFGLQVPYLRSSNLWEDTEHTTIAEVPRALDLLLFNRTEKSWGAHVALHIGAGQAIHLSKKIGKPVVWPIARFHELPEYAILIGAKRVKGRSKLDT
jgi:murein DD-endopeptidase / murein LD-carboxypeptidase